MTTLPQISYKPGDLVRVVKVRDSFLRLLKGLNGVIMSKSLVDGKILVRFGMTNFLMYCTEIEPVAAPEDPEALPKKTRIGCKHKPGSSENHAKAAAKRWAERKAAEPSQNPKLKALAAMPAKERKEA